MKTSELVVEMKKMELSEDSIEQIFNIIERKAGEIEGFTAPWTPQAKRADLKLAQWLKENGDGKTVADIATGFAKLYEGVDAETVQAIVDNDQLNLRTVKALDGTEIKKDHRKFDVKDGAVYLRSKIAKKQAVKLVKK